MKTRMRLLAGLVLSLICVGTNAVAADITECGSSDGWSYYLQGGLISKPDAGWQKDGVPNGKLLLTINGNEADIIYKDVAGTRSAIADGGKVFMQGELKIGYVQLIVLYPGYLTMEHYLFQLDEKGIGTVVWGTSRGANMVNKSSLFVASCKKP